MKIPNELIGKRVRYKYFLDGNYRIAGTPQYHRQVSIRGNWGWDTIYDNTQPEEKNAIEFTIAAEIGNFMKHYGQLRRTPNYVGYGDSEGEMVFSLSLVYQYNNRA